MHHINRPNVIFWYLMCLWMFEMHIICINSCPNRIPFWKCISSHSLCLFLALFLCCHWFNNTFNFNAFRVAHFQPNEKFHTRVATTSKWIIFSGWKNRWLIRFCEIMHKINHEAAIKMSCIMWIVVAAMKISYSTFEPI